MAITGLKILGTRERPGIDATGQIRTEVVITIQTDLGNIGDLVITQQRYNAMSDDQLQEAIIQKAVLLDRAHLLAE